MAEPGVLIIWICAINGSSVYAVRRKATHQPKQQICTFGRLLDYNHRYWYPQCSIRSTQCHLRMGALMHYASHMAAKTRCRIDIAIHFASAEQSSTSPHGRRKDHRAPIEKLQPLYQYQPLSQSCRAVLLQRASEVAFGCPSLQKCFLRVNSWNRRKCWTEKAPRYLHCKNI